MKRLVQFTFILCLAVSLSSCEKETPAAQVGSTDVEIVFTSPLFGESFNGANEVSIEARIEANAMMHGYRVTLTNKETGEIIESIDDIYEQTMYIVHHHWYPSFQDTTQVEIKIEALEGSMLILNSNTLDITCNP